EAFQVQEEQRNTTIVPDLSRPLRNASSFGMLTSPREFVGETQMDALRHYDAMRTAFKALTPADDVKARKALLDAKVIGFSEDLQINSALTVVRAFMKKLDDWDQQETVTR